MLLSLNGDGVMNVQEFVSRVVNHNKPHTPSASTPYRQLKRHHSTQVKLFFLVIQFPITDQYFTFDVHKTIMSMFLPSYHICPVLSLLFFLLQPFDEGGRRITTPSALSSTIGMRLFSTLDDGTGFTPVEYILDAWMEEGIENSTEILQVHQYICSSN